MSLGIEENDMCHIGLFDTSQRSVDSVSRFVHSPILSSLISPILMSMFRRCLCGSFLALGLMGARAIATGDWPDYLASPARDHYSSLAQINRGNVSRLEVAWEFHTGEPGEMQCNPLVVGTTLYGVTASGAVFALDAATGIERWRFVPTTEDSGTRRRVTLRGVSYWENGDDARLLFTAGSWLMALDAGTGQPIADFGVNGRVNLKAGLGDSAETKWVASTTPGTVFENLIVMPLRVVESAEAAPGFIQAFDIRTGELRWTFHTIPSPGEFGHETWSADSYRNIDVGGANSWAGMALDRERGLLFVPTGSAAPDFWGGSRRGANLFANCLLCLDARTGQRIWHYQFVHHDLWDRDLPAPPNLVTVTRDGQTVAAVAQVTKTGHVFVFHRETGDPLFPIEEIPVPASPLAGEEASVTQPVPLRPAPFARQTVAETQLNRYSKEHDKLRESYRRARTGSWQPFGLDTTLLLPGFDGGAEWGGAAISPSGVLFVNANEMAWLAQLEEPPKDDELAQLSYGRRIYSQFCMPCHGQDQQGNPAGRVPSLFDVQERLGREEIVALVAAGRGMMPGFPMLSQNDREAVADHLLGREKVEGADRLHRSPAPGVAAAPYKLKGYVKFVDSAGLPGISPPWGTLTAIDLNTGEHLWRIPLGEEPGLVLEAGAEPTGTENYGGPILTAGGVLFIAATKDGKFRAFDAESGTMLWETELPAAGFATPTTYAIDGRQFIVIAAGGTKLGTASGDSYVAFALPRE